MCRRLRWCTAGKNSVQQEGLGTDSNGRTTPSALRWVKSTLHLLSSLSIFSKIYIRVLAGPYYKHFPGQNHLWNCPGKSHLLLACTSADLLFFFHVLSHDPHGQAESVWETNKSDAQQTPDSTIAQGGTTWRWPHQRLHH